MCASAATFMGMSDCLALQLKGGSKYFEAFDLVMLGCVAVRLQRSGVRTPELWQRLLRRAAAAAAQAAAQGPEVSLVAAFAAFAAADVRILSAVQTLQGALIHSIGKLLPLDVAAVLTAAQNPFYFSHK